MNTLQKVLISAIRFYRRWISPMSAPCCRFYPSCSEYSLEAIQIHGVFYGSWLSIKRLIRCHPLCSGGHDPVPTRVHKCQDVHG